MYNIGANATQIDVKNVRPPSRPRDILMDYHVQRQYDISSHFTTSDNTFVLKS